MKAPEQILIVGPAWVGDMVMTHTLVQCLLEQYPLVQIDIMGPKWSVPLVQRMPGVRAAICADFGHGKVQFTARYQLAQRLKETRYDEAYLIPNSFKSALVPWLAGIPKRVGWLGEMRWGVLTHTRRLDGALLPKMTQRIATLQNFEVPNFTPPNPKLQVSRSAGQMLRKTFHLEKGKPMLVLCPGAAFGASKQWHLTGWSTVAKYYGRKGWDVLLLGSASDRPFCEKIAALSDGLCKNLSGKTSLEQAIDLMSMASSVVTNDSGMMHIAAALAVPLVAIYGSTDPSFTPPLSHLAQVVRHLEPCSPCFKRECPLKHHACMENISAATVIKALEKEAQVTCAY